MYFAVVPVLIAPQQHLRLDGWKAIEKHLNRDYSVRQSNNYMTMTVRSYNHNYVKGTKSDDAHLQAQKPQLGIPIHTLIPRSGEHELHTAPNEVVANISTTVSIAFGSTATTRSPFRTPTRCIVAAHEATCASISSYESSRRGRKPGSLNPTSAGREYSAARPDA